jgi:hypothetical protein
MIVLLLFKYWLLFPDAAGCAARNSAHSDTLPLDLYNHNTFINKNSRGELNTLISFWLISRISPLLLSELALNRMLGSRPIKGINAILLFNW